MATQLFSSGKRTPFSGLGPRGQDGLMIYAAVVGGRLSELAARRIFIGIRAAQTVAVDRLVSWTDRSGAGDGLRPLARRIALAAATVASDVINASESLTNGALLIGREATWDAIESGRRVQLARSRRQSSRAPRDITANHPEAYSRSGNQFD